MYIYIYCDCLLCSKSHYSHGACARILFRLMCGFSPSSSHFIILSAVPQVKTTTARPVAGLYAGRIIYHSIPTGVRLPAAAAEWSGRIPAAGERKARDIFRLVLLLSSSERRIGAPPWQRKQSLCARICTVDGGSPSVSSSLNRHTLRHTPNAIIKFLIQIKPAKMPSLFFACAKSTGCGGIFSLF